MVKRAYVIINEDHKLFNEQTSLLTFNYEIIEFYTVPKYGWTLNELSDIIKELSEKMKEGVDMVFVSPVPVLILKLAQVDAEGKVKVFHNDNRDKHQLPDGRITYSVAKTGWKLI